jgi:hypothetical protein
VTLTTTHKPLHALNETIGSIEFIQLWSAVAGKAPLYISMTVISAILVFVKNLSETLSLFQNVVTNQFIVVLFDTSLSGYTLLNASRTAADSFVAK